MKIIVANDQEKQFIDKFVKELIEFDIAQELHDVSSEYDGDFGADEVRIIEWALKQARIEIDLEASNIMLEDDSLITGICRFCGKQTQGMEDYEEKTYAEYVHMMSEEQQKKWQCYDCYMRVCECCDEALTATEEDTLCEQCKLEEVE